MFDWYWSFLFYFLIIHIMWTSYSIYIHRGLAHGVFNFSPNTEKFFRILLWMCNYHWPGYKRTFTLHHKLHHMYPDTNQDPHSPRHFTLKEMINVTDTSNPNSPYHIPVEFAKKFPNIKDHNDTLEKFLVKYSGKGYYLLHLIGLILYGPIGLIIGIIIFYLWSKYAMTFVGNFMSHGIGSLTKYKHPHHNKKINHEAVNFMPFGLLFGGEELHSNHHCYPGVANLRYRWWEFDIGYFYICILKIFNLVTIKEHI